jgi:hypothetical protein
MKARPASEPPRRSFASRNSRGLVSIRPSFFVWLLLVGPVGLGMRAAANPSYPSNNNVVVTDSDYNITTLTDWYLSSKDQVYTNISANGLVPGDVISILLRAQIVQDPYQDRNFLTQRHIWMGGEKDPDDGNFTRKEWTRTWIYSTTFSTPDRNSTETLSWKVILEGIKMGADILVNGVKVGEGSLT